MNNKNIIKPSAETLVVGARVKLRNGETTAVCTIDNQNASNNYPIACENDRWYTRNGTEWMGTLGDMDIIEVLPQEAINTVNVSIFKIGDTIKFKNGLICQLTALEEENNGYRKLYFTSSNCNIGYWSFKNDGTPHGFGAESTHTLIEHFPKTTEATALATNAVAYPLHYTEHPRGLGCIQITQHMSFNLGNVVESVWLSSLKETTALDAIEHLKIAYWFLKQEIERLEKQ